MGQPQHGYTTRTARAEARPEDSGISSGRLRATRGCRVSRAARHKGTHDPDKQPHHHQKQRQSGGAAPVTGPCTRSGALHPIRRGALPTDQVQHPNAQEQTRNWQTEPLLAHIQPEHRTPGGRRAAIVRPVDTALPRAHPQRDIASHRAQTVVGFAPNTRFRRISPKWTAL